VFGAACEAAKRQLGRTVVLAATAVTLMVSTVPALAAGRHRHRHHAYGHSSSCFVNPGRGLGDSGVCHANSGVGHGSSAGASSGSRGHKVG
jgi:hypothetical protein